MKSSELIGQRVRIVVNETPCACRMDGHDVLTETVTGKIERFIRMPAGPIGVLRTDDGRAIVFDAYNDIGLGKIELERITH